MLSGGIVSIVVRKSRKGGNVAIAILFGLGVLIDFGSAGGVADLGIWVMWCLVNAVLSLMALWG